MSYREAFEAWLSDSAGDAIEVGDVIRSMAPLQAAKAGWQAALAAQQKAEPPLYTITKNEDGTHTTTVSSGLDPEGIKLLREARRGHYYCEDSWYSCPKAEDGCADESQGTECNCGADEWNAKIDAYLAKYPGA